eukprot:11358597-Karenia_brevis.AAC.1
MHRQRGGRYGVAAPPMDIPADAHILHFDGAARGNPGPAGSGAVLFAPQCAGGGVLWAGSAF